MNIEPIISVITQIELFSSSKTPAHELQLLQAFVSQATVYNAIDEQIIQHVINIRKTIKLKHLMQLLQLQH